VADPAVAGPAFVETARCLMSPLGGALGFCSTSKSGWQAPPGTGLVRARLSAPMAAPPDGSGRSRPLRMSTSPSTDGPASPCTALATCLRGVASRGGLQRLKPGRQDAHTPRVRTLVLRVRMCHGGAPGRRPLVRCAALHVTDAHAPILDGSSAPPGGQPIMIPLLRSQGAGFLGWSTPGPGWISMCRWAPKE